MKRIPFDIKYRPEIESGKYKVETEDGRAVRIVCFDAPQETNPIYGFIEGEKYITNWRVDGRLIKGIHPSNLIISTDEVEEQPIITELKEHLASLSEDDKQKEWEELQNWYNEYFQPEHKDWVEEFRKKIEAMSPEEFEEKWREIKKRCGEENETKLSDFESELRYWIGQALCNYEDNGAVPDNMSSSVNIYLYKAAKNLLSIAYKQFEKERLELPENKLDSIDFFFDHWILNNINASARECFRTGYACGRASADSKVPKWKKNGYCVCGGCDRDVFLIRTAPGYYFTSAVLSPNCEYIELSDLENLPNE